MSIDETKKLLKKLQGKKDNSNELKSLYKKTKEIEKRLGKQVREDKKAKEEKKKKRNLENLVSTINVLKKLENVKDSVKESKVIINVLQLLSVKKKIE